MSSLIRRVGVMTLTIDPNAMTLEIPGQPIAVLKRPPAISTVEWEELWEAKAEPRYDHKVPGSSIGHPARPTLRRPLHAL